ncbi:MAG TPA: hypothetical protein VHF90_09695 [Thermoleophilaceae bacterium]|nr:hypothetical protein [Thermoleophilaceae bacterium]
MIGYVVLITAYPLFGNQEINPGLFYAGWLGSSYVAGIAMPRRWMLIVPGLVFLVLLGVMATGLSTSELLADPLSSVALLVIAAGQTGGIRLGLATVSYGRRRRGP